jgi:hypothetical protein
MTPRPNMYSSFDPLVGGTGDRTGIVTVAISFIRVLVLFKLVSTMIIRRENGECTSSNDLKSPVCHQQQRRQ